jgi:hypothetical protein
VCLEGGPLSLVRITEELLEWKSNGSGSRKRRLTAVSIRCADPVTTFIRKSWHWSHCRSTTLCLNIHILKAHRRCSSERFTDRAESRVVFASFIIQGYWNRDLPHLMSSGFQTVVRETWKRGMMPKMKKGKRKKWGKWETKREMKRRKK